MNINKYEANHTEPNTYNYNYNTLKSKNNNLFQNKFFSKNNITPLTKIQNERERFSVKPEIRTDASRYNLNFMKNSKENYSMNINNILK